MTATARIMMALLILLSRSVRGLVRTTTPSPSSGRSRSRSRSRVAASSATADPADGNDPSGRGGGGGGGAPPPPPPPLSQTPRKFTVTWKAADGKDATFVAFEGETLRTSALRRGVVSPHNGRSRLVNCRGLGTCGTCAVEIAAGEVRPTGRSRIEDMRLSLPPHGGGIGTSLRLACQVQVFGDVTVVKRTGFWGQHDAVAEISEAVTYFGDMEYLLDRKSPASLPTGTQTTRPSGEASDDGP